MSALDWFLVAAILLLIARLFIQQPILVEVSFEPDPEAESTDLDDDDNSVDYHNELDH